MPGVVWVYCWRVWCRKMCMKSASWPSRRSARHTILDLIDAFCMLEILSFGRCPINRLKRHALVLSISYLYSCRMTLCVADLVACACFTSFIPHADFKPSSSGHESRRYKKEHINRRRTCICIGACLHVIRIVHC